MENKHFLSADNYKFTQLSYVIGNVTKMLTESVRKAATIPGELEEWLVYICKFC
jgi:hypothetical protein